MLDTIGHRTLDSEELDIAQYKSFVLDWVHIKVNLDDISYGSVLVWLPIPEKQSKRRAYQTRNRKYAMSSAEQPVTRRHAGLS